jgi:biotin carboxylase
MTLHDSHVLLLMGPATYRSAAFSEAAERLGLPVIRGLDLPQALASHWQVDLPLDFSEPEQAAARIAAFAQTRSLRAVLSVDDSATTIAALASQLLGLPHNEPASALAARDKLVMRQRLAEAGVPVPDFSAHPLDREPLEIAEELRFPVVVKPTGLNGSRGVIRADDPQSFATAWQRTRRMLLDEGHQLTGSVLLVEEYLPGVEVALEGLLTGGELQVLALFDKPDPLEGPFFEETIYVTPSRLPTAMQEAIAAATAAAAAALGLREGPVHAELRMNDRGVWPIELAGRSIGGLCSTILEFGSGVSLEELILRHAVGWDLPTTGRHDRAVGVMMIPIPRGGVLRCVEGQDDALEVPGVTGIEITARPNYPIVPLPEGSAYLGFIFAEGESPAEVEAALRRAHSRLRIRIDPVLSLSQVPQQPVAADGATGKSHPVSRSSTVVDPRSVRRRT